MIFYKFLLLLLLKKILPESLIPTFNNSILTTISKHTNTKSKGFFVLNAALVVSHIHIKIIIRSNNCETHHFLKYNVKIDKIDSAGCLHNFFHI